MSASLPRPLAQGKTDDVVVVKPFQWGDWPALWHLRSCQLAELGIVVDLDPPSRPDLNSPYERDYHRIEQVYLRGWGNFWIAWIKDQPIGHIGAQDLGKYIELRRMYVRDTFRRAGIGTQLVATLLEHCQEYKVRHIKLWTDAAGPGRILYRSVGFQEVEDSNKKGELVPDAKGEIRMALSQSV